MLPVTFRFWITWPSLLVVIDPDEGSDEHGVAVVPLVGPTPPPPACQALAASHAYAGSGSPQLPGLAKQPPAGGATGGGAAVVVCDVVDVVVGVVDVVVCDVVDVVVGVVDVVV
jgi:hypothetical protein